MTFKQKLEHLWAYYKGTLVILIVVIALCSVVVTCIQNKNTDTLLSGMGINVYLTDEGKAYIKEEYFEQVKTGGREQVLYTEVTQEDYNKTAALEESYTQLMLLLAMATSGDLDYLLVDELAIRNMLAHQVFSDLRPTFTEEELEALGDKILWAQVGGDEDGKFMPFAINLQHIPFIDKHSQAVSDTYLILVNGSPRLEKVKEFITYLEAWTPAA